VFETKTRSNHFLNESVRTHYNSDSKAPLCLIILRTYYNEKAYKIITRAEFSAKMLEP
jgi:hypothetical protein